MTEKTINILKSLKIGEIYPAYKPIGKQEIEEQEILSKLYRIEVLSKTPKGSYKVGNSKLLSKFIELKDFKKLVEYIENESTNQNITHNYNNVSQVNHSSGNIDLKSPIRQKIVNKTEIIPNKKSWLEILSWVIGSIIGLIGIYEFIIKRFLFE